MHVQQHACSSHDKSPRACTHVRPTPVRRLTLWCNRPFPAGDYRTNLSVMASAARHRAVSLRSPDCGEPRSARLRTCSGRDGGPTPCKSANKDCYMSSITLNFGFRRVLWLGEDCKFLKPLRRRTRACLHNGQCHWPVRVGVSPVGSMGRSHPLTRLSYNSFSEHTRKSDFDCYNKHATEPTWKPADGSMQLCIHCPIFNILPYNIYHNYYM